MKPLIFMIKLLNLCLKIMLDIWIFSYTFGMLKSLRTTNFGYIGRKEQPQNDWLQQQILKTNRVKISCLKKLHIWKFEKCMIGKPYLYISSINGSMNPGRNGL